MPRGGYRPGAGRPKGKQPKWFPKDKVIDAQPTTNEEIKQEVSSAVSSSDITPLEYMLKVMRDETQPKDRRDRMAALAAPFCHSRAGEKGGKKQEREAAAKEAGKGRFGAMSGPKVVNINK